VFAVVVAVDQFLAPRTSHRYDLNGRQREHGSLGQWETPFQDQVEKSIWLRWSLTFLGSSSVTVLENLQTLRGYTRKS